MDNLVYNIDMVSSVADVATACIALYVAIFIHRKSILIDEARDNAAWEKEFLELYREFWKDDCNTEVRSMIANSQCYEKLKPILEKRLQTTDNTLEPNESIQIDKIDQFAATLNRILLLKNRRKDLSDKQTELWETMHFNYWIRKINIRTELRKYLQDYWPGLLKNQPIQHEQLEHQF